MIFFPVFSVVLLIALLLAPLGLYLRYGWAARRRIIITPFTDGAVRLYLKRTAPPGDKEGEAVETVSLRKRFEDVFDSRYGRQFYFVPTLLLFLIGGFLILLCVNTVFQKLTAPIEMFPLSLDPVAVAAIAGAYVWVVYDLILRERSLDLSTTHVNRASFRFAAAIPMGYAVGRLVFPTEVQVAVAVLIGAFPTDYLMRVVRRLANKRLGLTEPESELKTRLENLQCIDSTISDRLGEEGITSIGQLAYADPVGLTIQSGLDFVLVIDCISQALLWVYTEEYLPVLKLHSLRGALEVSAFVYYLREARKHPSKEDNQATIRESEDLLKRIAADCKASAADIERSLNLVEDDDSVKFLSSLWENM